MTVQIVPSILFTRPRLLDRRLRMNIIGSPLAFGGASTALQVHVLAHLRHGAPLENAARDYLVNLHVQAAAYESHASGRRVPMPASDPHHP